jgi:nitrate/nitrite transporter NarK
MGAVGGFVGPYLLGAVKERTGDFTAGLLILVAVLVVAAGIALGMRRLGQVAGGSPLSDTEA